MDTKPFLWNNYGPDHKYPASSPAGSGVPGICSPTSGAADSVCSPVTPHQVGPARASDINVHQFTQYMGKVPTSAFSVLKV